MAEVASLRNDTGAGPQSGTCGRATLKARTTPNDIAWAGSPRRDVPEEAGPARLSATRRKIGVRKIGVSVQKSKELDSILFYRQGLGKVWREEGEAPSCGGRGGAKPALPAFARCTNPRIEAQSPTPHFSTRWSGHPSQLVGLPALCQKDESVCRSRPIRRRGAGVF